MKIFRFFTLFISLLLFFSCAARISGSLSENGSLALSVNMALEPRITSMLRSLAAAGGTAEGNILDGEVITASMSGAPGITLVSFRNINPSAIEGTVQISNINEFLAVAEGGGFINFVQGSSGGSCRININRNNGPVILELLSSEISDYLNALMAPIASGEEMTRSEYLELVASFYNRAVSEEIAGSRFRVSINFPGTVSTVRGGVFSGRTAEFDISLLDLLVLETPLSYEVIWR